MNKLILTIALLTGIFMQTGFAQNAAVSTQFNKALQGYYDLKNALAEDKTDAAVKSAAALQAAVKKVPHQGFANEKQHQLWMKESGVILKSTAELSNTTDLKAQRKSFEGISSSFITLVKDLKVNEDTVFVEYCPMVKLSWLNEVKAVQNPYYGSKMYECGTVRETLDKK